MVEIQDLPPLLHLIRFSLVDLPISYSYDWVFGRRKNRLPYRPNIIRCKECTGPSHVHLDSLE